MESHLFDDINFFPSKMRTLILGTFPIPLYTNKKMFEKLSLYEKQNAWYYSSKRSEFWKIIAESFDIDYKNDDFLFNKSKKKEIFKKNKIGVADVFLKCKRKKEESSKDTDLIIIEYNNILSEIINNDDLNLIIFTSRFTENNFFKILHNNNINYEKKYSKEAYEYYNKGFNDIGITNDIINALTCKRSKFIFCKKRNLQILFKK